MSTQSSAPVRRLYCSCCGEFAGRWHQHWNMDAGIGACVRCVTFLRTRGETEEEIRSRYGAEGVNWGMSIVVYGLAFRVAAAFREHEEGLANQWMAQHPTHALLAIHEGLLLLADVSEPGVKPPADAPVGAPASAGNMRLFPAPHASEVNREINAPLAQGTERTMINRKEG